MVCPGMTMALPGHLVYVYPGHANLPLPSMPAPYMSQNPWKDDHTTAALGHLYCKGDTGHNDWMSSTHLFKAAKPVEQH